VIVFSRIPSIGNQLMQWQCRGFHIWL
jgi:hypothetical protein